MDQISWFIYSSTRSGLVMLFTVGPFFQPWIPEIYIFDKGNISPSYKLTQQSFAGLTL